MGDRSFTKGGSSTLQGLKEKMQKLRAERDEFEELFECEKKKCDDEKCRREECEGEIAGLNRRVQLLEEDFERSEERLNSATQKLEEASKAADESERGRRTLENKSFCDDGRIDHLEHTLKERNCILTEVENKYDEACRRVAVLEQECERNEDKATNAVHKVLELEEELRVVGNNMKSLEISEQEASQREDNYESLIRDTTQRLKDAEMRATEAERQVVKLQKEVDRLEVQNDSLNCKLTYNREEIDALMTDLHNL